MQTFEAAFPRGNCPIDAFGDLDDQAAPIVLMYPDFFGRRPTSHAIARELAADGCRVLMPEYFYDMMPYEPIPPKSIFEGGERHEQLMRMFSQVTQPRMDEDSAALLAFAQSLPGTQAPIVTTGYCMGGRYALTTACASQRVVLAAAFHASNLAPLDQDGPHRRFAQTRARLYIGVAGIDPTYGAEEHGRLAQALREAETDHVIETYHQCAHGWVFPDIPIYNEAAAARHLRRIREHMADLL